MSIEPIINPTQNKSSNIPPDRPFDLVPLPSAGRLYTHPALKGVTGVECHYLTAREEDILTSPNLIRSGDLFTTLLKSILRDKSIPPELLLVGDRNAILVWTRINAYGEKYPVKINCPSCDETYANEFDLSKLDVRTLEAEATEDGFFSLTLPQSRKSVKIKFLTAQDEKDIWLTERKKEEVLKQKISNTITLRLEKIIVDVNDNRDFAEIKKFIETMPIADSRYIRKFIDDNEPKIIMKQETICKNCGLVREADIPLTENFFWPDI